MPPVSNRLRGQKRPSQRLAKPTPSPEAAPHRIATTQDHGQGATPTTSHKNTTPLEKKDEGAGTYESRGHHIVAIRDSHRRNTGRGLPGHLPAVHHLDQDGRTGASPLFSNISSNSCFLISKLALLYSVPGRRG